MLKANLNGIFLLKLLKSGLTASPHTRQLWISLHKRAVVWAQGICYKMSCQIRIYRLMSFQCRLCNSPFCTPLKNVLPVTSFHLTLIFYSTALTFFDSKVNITKEGEILHSSQFWHNTQRHMCWFQVLDLFKWFPSLERLIYLVLFFSL